VIKTLFVECGVLLSWLPLERHKTELTYTMIT
jgi:hypothetical protein